MGINLSSDFKFFSLYSSHVCEAQKILDVELSYSFLSIVGALQAPMLACSCPRLPPLPNYSQDSLSPLVN